MGSVCSGSLCIPGTFRMEAGLTRIILLIPLLLAASTEGRTGKSWRYWPNIGCFNFNFERTVFFEVTNGATELSATKGLELSTIVNSSLVPSLDNELQVQHVLTGSIRNSTTNTPEECITFCNATEYAYAGLQEGNRCVCMNEPPLSKTTAERCNAACSGDGDLSCGGEWTMDVHQNPHYHSSNLTYIGCFKNSYNDFDRLLIEGEFNNFRNNTPEWCVDFCTNRDYDYAGLQYGSQCICTNTGPQENSEEGKCTYGCAGDQSIKMCGGLGYINIFHTDAHKTTIDDWGCGNSAQDQYYQKWYADMDHCGLTEELPPAPTEAPAGTTTTTTTARTTTTTTIATTTTVTTSVGYMEVTSGTGCGSNGLRITTKEECEAAANELGLSFSQSVIEIDRVDSWPSQCFYPGNPAFGSNVFFNKDTTSTIPCDSDQRKCICKKIVAEGEQCNQNSECETDLLCDGNLKKCRKRDPGNQGGFCSVGGILCQEAEGDCDKHRECEGSLLCGTFGQFDNKMCQFFDPTHRHTWDCCFSPNATTGFSRENEPCKIDEHCGSGLKCDTNIRYSDEPNTYRCRPDYQNMN